MNTEIVIGVIAAIVVVVFLTMKPSKGKLKTTNDSTGSLETWDFSSPQLSVTFHPSNSTLDLTFKLKGKTYRGTYPVNRVKFESTPINVTSFVPDTAWGTTNTGTAVQVTLSTGRGIQEYSGADMIYFTYKPINPKQEVMEAEIPVPAETGNLFMTEWKKLTSQLNR